MRARLLRVTLALGCFVLLMASLPKSGHAQALSPAEKIYADLAKLPPQERHDRLVEGARKEGKLVLVHTWTTPLAKPHIELFKQAYPFIEVDWNDMGSQDAAERFTDEETAGKHLTDLLSLAVYDMQSILDHDFAARYPTPASAAILPRYRQFLDSQNRWTPFYVSDFGITYNPTMIKPEDAPKDWFDLCKPVFKGNVSFDPATVRFLVGLDAMMGDAKMQQWLECIGKNDPIVQATMADRFQLMIAGDHIAQGQNYVYYCFAAKAKNPNTPCAAVLNVPLIGLAGAMLINRNAQHPYTAALMTDWSLTQESQEYTAKNFRGPLAIKHPYLPDDAQLIAAPLPDKAEVDKVLGYWKKYIGK
jgi:iron(III) transport system substrate-binding protein